MINTTPHQNRQVSIKTRFQHPKRNAANVHQHVATTHDKKTKVASPNRPTLRFVHVVVSADRTLIVRHAKHCQTKTNPAHPSARLPRPWHEAQGYKNVKRFVLLNYG